MNVATKSIRLEQIRVRETSSGVPQSSSSSREMLLFAGVLALTLATYASTFTFGWVYDDNPQIFKNPDLRWSRAWYLVTHHLWAFMPDVEARFYRPLLEFWFLINKSLFGLNPHWFHVTTVLAHVLATALAYVVARMLFRSHGAALLASAIFGLHPLQAEVASWISSVNDSLMAVFCFASFIAARKARTLGRPGLWVLSGLLFFIAVFIKESSVLLPVIICIDICTETNSAAETRPVRRTLMTAGLTYVPVALVWFVIRRSVLGNAARSFDFVAWTTALLSIPKILLGYLRRTIVPTELSPHYDFKLVASIISWQFIGPVLVLAALSVMGFFLARRQRALALAYAWIIVPLLPALNLRWMNYGDFLHDRYTYLTIFGFALCVGAAFEFLSSRCAASGMLRLIPVILVLGLAFASAIQSQFWANDVYLFSRAVRIAPENEWAHLDYGAALMSRGRFTEAAQEAVRSYQLRQGWRSANSAAFAYFEANDLTQSKRWYVTALQVNPRIGVAWFTLGQIRLREQSPADALQFFSNALQLQPEEEGYHYALGVALEHLARSPEALAAYTTELKLHPSFRPAGEAVARLTKN
jgi:tetratricopeptide (TPR) repeat protein